MAKNILDQSAQLENFGVSLHRAIVNNLIGEIETAIAERRIRSADGRHSVYDFIRENLGFKNERDAWERFSTTFPEVVGFCDNFKFLGKRQRFTPTTDTNQQTQPN